MGPYVSAPTAPRVGSLLIPRLTTLGLSEGGRRCVTLGSSCIGANRASASGLVVSSSQALGLSEDSGRCVMLGSLISAPTAPRLRALWSPRPRPLDFPKESGGATNLGRSYRRQPRLARAVVDSSPHGPLLPACRCLVRHAGRVAWFSRLGLSFLGPRSMFSNLLPPL